ncbi:phage major capsid protein [Phaeobacter gallaeciensis]|uniref:phage major capsid protein n=1 Tax=Phaeobacter gallaeciensis TaxID=60890 RepID=UPI0003D6B23B|nr:phage major capsid protein [Phaeobacter gallaeciensis]AHD12149.1 phage major capsid protein, HK97 family [Phaeobacter gallaeciensis DSM 26640]ATE95333.1 phage major capsid protein, HK97 family [Phaeobacter gallaeciensis]
MKQIMMPAISVAALASSCPANVLSIPCNDASDAEMLKEIKNALGKIESEVKGTAEDALKEAKKSGEVSAETKASADKLLANQAELTNSLKSLTDKVEGLTAQNIELAQNFAAGSRDGADGPMSLGQAVVAQHDQVKAFSGSAVRLDIQNAITTADGSAGGLIYREEERDPVRMPKRRLLIASLLNRGSVNSDAHTYRKQVIRAIAAAMVAEGSATPESNYGWTKVTDTVRKIGHHINVSEESLADADYLQAEIDTELRYGLDLEEEKQILAGDGIGENHLGLISVAPNFVAADASLPNASRIDRLRLAILQIALEDHFLTSFVLNPIDWAGIEMTKNTVGDYIFSRPDGVATPVLWGRDVVESNSMSKGEWLGGDLAMSSTLYDRQQTEVKISTEHGNNFIEGMVTIQAKKRQLLAHKRPLATVKGDFTFA